MCSLVGQLGDELLQTHGQKISDQIVVLKYEYLCVAEMMHTTVALGQVLKTLCLQMINCQIGRVYMIRWRIPHILAHAQNRHSSCQPQVFTEVFMWQPGSEVVVKLKRGEEEININTTLTQSYTSGNGLMSKENATNEQIALRNAWLKG